MTLGLGVEGQGHHRGGPGGMGMAVGPVSTPPQPPTTALCLWTCLF